MLTHLTTILATTPPTERPTGFSTVGQMMAAMGVLLLCFTMLSLLRRRMRQQAHQRGQSVKDRIRAVREQATGRSATADAPSPHVSSAAKTTVESVMADAEELTRRLAALLDNKAAALEILIDRAETAAQRLEAASETSHSPAVVQAPNAPLPDPIAEEVYALADRGKAALDIARELDEPTGKIELMLALRQPSQAKSN